MVDIVCPTKIRLNIYFATTMRYQEIVMLECTNAYGKVCPDVWGKLRRKSKIKFSCAKYRYGRFVVIAFSFEIDPEFGTEIEHLAEFYGILRANVESPRSFFVIGIIAHGNKHVCKSVHRRQELVTCRQSDVSEAVHILFVSVVLGHDTVRYTECKL